MVNLLLTGSTACGGKAALLEGMIVDPSRRGDGLGSELFMAQSGCPNCTRKRMYKEKGDHPVAFFVAAVIC